MTIKNIAIKKAKNEIVAITDAGCTPHKDWLEKITEPFKKTDNDVVAGGYQMVAQNNFEKAEAVFLGVKQQDIKSDFLPSLRSTVLDSGKDIDILQKYSFHFPLL